MDQPITNKNFSLHGKLHGEWPKIPPKTRVIVRFGRQRGAFETAFERHCSSPFFISLGRELASLSDVEDDGA
jgi:hypothetical protein